MAHPNPKTHTPQHIAEIVENSTILTTGELRQQLKDLLQVMPTSTEIKKMPSSVQYLLRSLSRRTLLSSHKQTQFLLSSLKGSIISSIKKRRPNSDT